MLTLREKSAILLNDFYVCTNLYLNQRRILLCPDREAEDMAAEAEEASAADLAEDTEAEASEEAGDTDHHPDITASAFGVLVITEAADASEDFWECLCFP